MSRTSPSPPVPIDRVRVAAFRIPTEAPESDGTLAWDAVTLVVVEVSAGGRTGLGYTYGDASVATLIHDQLESAVTGRDAFAVDALWRTMLARLRNMGRQGATAMAVAAVDIALWDLKARLLDLPLVDLLGRVRETLPIYGSGGFTSYSDRELQQQFVGWRDQGVTKFKMKVAREPERDRHRVAFARKTIGDAGQLFVDANSAYRRREALEWAHIFSEDADVLWLEQPLPPTDLAGLRWLRERGPRRLQITDGEYGYDTDYFVRLLRAEAVDVVMADATRCAGLSGLLRVATLCEAWSLPLSSHCAPAIHLHPGCALGPMIHAEYFHDHARIEQELFDGAPTPEGGELLPDLSRPGHGLSFKWADAARYAA